MSNLFRHLSGPVAEIHKPAPVILPEFYKFQPDILYALFWVSSMANNKVIKRKLYTTDIKEAVKRAFKGCFMFSLRTIENSRRAGIFSSVEKGGVLSELLYYTKKRHRFMSCGAPCSKKVIKKMKQHEKLQRPSAGVLPQSGKIK